MLADLFNDEELYEPIPDPSSDKKGTNCADNLPEPEMPRGSSNFVGLYNQGATCYMNSALQILYMTPKFRNLINSLILCDKILGNPTEFIPQGQKYNIILSLQKLFSELNLMNIKATKTKELTEAFGWEKNEGGDQHDSQEFIRILLFDVLERILYDTPFNNIINNIYKVNYISNMQCSNCGNLKSKIESEYVLNLQILNMKGLKESLFSSFGFEEIIEDYNCEKCNKKVSLKKWSKIISLPNYINFGLNRFSYDYTTFERIKLNNKFEFPLELNMKEFCDFSDKNIEQLNDNDYLYELYGVIVHSGTPFSGHYYSYIRDMTSQGKWKLEEMTNINNNKNNININKKEEEEKNNEDIKGKNKGKKKNKKNKENKNDKENKEKQDNDINIKENENEKDFPIPYENKSLKENWFEFNDTSVTSMPISRLEKVFKGRASAYMLFYSKKENNKEKIEILPPPDYLKIYLDELNQNLEKERINYEKEKNTFIINFYNEKNFILNKEEQIIQLNENSKTNFLIEKKYNFTDKISYLFEKENSINKICFLFHIINKGEIKYIIIDNKINYEENKDMTLKELGFYHYCNIIFVENNSEIFDLNYIKIGKEFEPVLLKFFYNGNILEVKTFGCYYINELKNILEKKIDLKKNEFEIYFPSGNKKIFLDDNVILKKNSKEEKNIKELNLENKNILYITLKEEKNCEEKKDINEINLNNETKNITECIVKFEDDESTVKIVQINLDKTFYDLYQLINKQFDIIKEKYDENITENVINTENDIVFRLYNESEGKIISKELFNKKLNTSPTFVEGDVRLRIEIGEIYNENEISLNIIMKSLNDDSKQIEKEFICDPNKYTIFQVKKFLLDNIIETETKEEKEKLYQNYLLYRTNLYNLPTKPIKLEKEFLSNLGIKDRDVLFLQNILEIPDEIAYINIIFSDKEIYHYDLCKNFEKINFYNYKEKLELKLPKKTTIKELKEKIKNSFNKKIDNDLLLIRVIGKYYQLERILKNDNYDLKKYNLESPINLFIEELKEPIFNSKNNTDTKEQINNENKKGKKSKEKEKETLIVLMQKNKEENIYENKKIYFIQNDTNIFSTKELYDLCRIHSNWMNISIAKYNKGNFQYEEIKEYDKNNKAFSLRKGNYSLRDSDWIAIINLDNDDNFLTDFDIVEQNEIKKRKEELKKLKLKEKNSKKNYEKPLRIKLDD